MKEVLLDEKEILEYIRDILNKLKSEGSDIIDAKYHHSTDYKNAPSICRYGILTLLDQNKLGLRNDDNNFLKKMNDTDSHVNGINSVSLAVPELDDLYPNEYEYDSSSPFWVDFLVSNNVKAGRFSENYGNEFLSFESIKKEDLKSIDIRLLQLMNLRDSYFYNVSIEDFIKKYNYLRNIALEVINQKLEIPLREMSDSKVSALDTEKLSKMPKLVLKK